MDQKQYIDFGSGSGVGGEFAEKAVDIKCSDFPGKNDSADKENEPDNQYNHHSAPLDFFRRRLVGLGCGKIPLVFAHKSTPLKSRTTFI